MRLDLAALWRDAWGLWRRDGALLLPLTGLAIFLPRLALQLLVPAWPMPDSTATGEAAMQAWSEAFVGWVGRYGGWFLLAMAVGLWGALAIVALYLDRGRPTLAGALARGLALLPRYLLATILVGLPVGALMMLALAMPLLFVVVLAPLFYLYARMVLIAPALAAEAPLGAVGAIVRSWQLTRGHGWTLAWLLAALMLGSSLLGGGIAALGTLGRAAAASPVWVSITAVLGTLVESAATLGVALVGVAAYRRLASSGT